MIVILFFPLFFHAAEVKRDALARATKTISSTLPQKENKKNHGISGDPNFRDFARAVSFSCSFRQDFFYDRLQFMLTRFSKVASREF